MTIGASKIKIIDSGFEQVILNRSTGHLNVALIWTGDQFSRNSRVVHGSDGKWPVDNSVEQMFKMIKEDTITNQWSHWHVYFLQTKV